MDADAATKKVTLDLDGTVVDFAHGPSRATQISWPGPKSAKLTFDPPPAGTPAGLSETGPWAMQRLFARAQVQPAAAPDSYDVTFQLGDRKAVFQIHGTPAGNPVAPAQIKEFKCPGVQ